jgi:hypothetical protein
MTTTTSKPFANASSRSRYAGLRGAFVAAFVASITAGFVLSAQQGPAQATPGAEQVLVAGR